MVKIPKICCSGYNWSNNNNQSGKVKESRQRGIFGCNIQEIIVVVIKDLAWYNVWKVEFSICSDKDRWIRGEI